MNNLNNERGSILVITTAFVLIFTMMGVAAIYTAGEQNKSADKQRASDQGFWLADGGVEIAKNSIKKSGVGIASSITPVNIGSGSDFRYYDVYAIADPDCSYCTGRWLVHSCGAISNQSLSNTSTWCTTNHQGASNADRNQVRTVEVIIAKYDITDVLDSEGPIKNYDPNSQTDCLAGSASVGVSGTNCNGTNCSCTNLVKQNISIDFADIFNGLSLSTVVSGATNVYNNVNKDNDIKSKTISNVTVITLASNLSGNNITIPVDNVVGTPFLIINTQALSSTPTITFNGNKAFSGIIWIEGNASIKGNGNATINGAVFINGNSGTQSTLSGNLKLYFNAANIAGAVTQLNNPATNTPAVISWKEI